MSDDDNLGKRTDFHSRSVDAAAARWGDKHPEEDPEHPTPSHVPEDEEVVPNRHSARTSVTRRVVSRRRTSRPDRSARRR